MAFQIKDFASIVAAEINHAKSVTNKITDFAPGSVSRTLMEAPAVEIEELYLQMFLGLREAIPVSTFISFGFDKRPAKVASGFASVSRPIPLEVPITIPFGTVFTTDAGVNFLASADVVWQAGTSLTQIPVQAELAGAASNVPTGAITSSAIFSANAGVVVGNAAITNGADAESDAEREARFADFIRSLSRGTVAACRYHAGLSSLTAADGALTEYVTRLGLSEIPGRVSIYLYSNLGVPSAELLADGQRRLDGYRDDSIGLIVPGVRSAGVQVDVLPMVEREIDVAIAVKMRAGFALTPAVIQALTDTYNTAIRNVPAGSILYLGDLTELLLLTPGLEAIVPQTNENIISDVSEALTPGTLTVTPLL